MIKNILFIGGTWDGQVIGLEENMRYAFAPSEAVEVSPIIGNEPPELMKTIEYKRETLAEDGKKTFDVMWHRDSDKGLIEILLDSYARN